MGSALNGGVSDDHAADSVTRVPAGLEALVADRAACSGRQASWHASAGIIGGTLDGSVSCSYSLQPDAEQAGSGMHIAGMLFKPVGGTSVSAAAAAAAAAAKAEAEHLMYVVQWEVNSGVTAQQHSMAQHTPRDELCWNLGSGRKHLRLHAAPGAALEAVQGSLRLLQFATSSREHPTVALHTQLLMPGVRNASTAHAAAAGLLKVAARECSGQHFAHVTYDAFAASAVHVPPQSTDMFGDAVAGK